MLSVLVLLALTGINRQDYRFNQAVTIGHNMDSFWQTVTEQISSACSQPFNVENTLNVSGGCINTTTVLEGSGQRYFVKTNRADLLPMFEAEGEALAEMAATDTVRVPEPVCWGSTDDRSWLVMEHIPLGGRGSQARLGEQLAAMHRHCKDRFGWHRDNTIGSTPQYNDWHDDWVAFFRDQRLGAQLSMAANKGYGGRLQQLGERLMETMHMLFTDYRPTASMLHGDLWGGNASTDDTGQPVIFDPALYYGDREADIAMTELFGGFSREFYSAYNASWPLDNGYAVRKTLYNTYHIINHLNLFGGGYGSQAERMMGSLLSELK